MLVGLTYANLFLTVQVEHFSKRQENSAFLDQQPQFGTTHFSQGVLLLWLNGRLPAPPAAIP